MKSVFERFRLDGRWAVVTGGSRGLGRVMAAAFAEAGANLVLVGREAESLQSAQQELQKYGGSVETIVGDVGVVDEIPRIAAEANDKAGPIDILVNNVGGRRINIATEDLTLAEWQRIVDLNLTGTFRCCQEFGKGMIERKRGSIINITSIAGLIVSKGIFGRAYETCKAAVGSFTKALAADWAVYNIRVNAIAPGVFLTAPNQKWFGEMPMFRQTFEEMIPMGRLGNPEEIGPLALYLASDASSYMTGSTLVIDGGYTLW